MIRKILVFCSCVIVLMSCAKANEQVNYNAVYADENLTIDGKMYEAVWEKAHTEELNEFYKIEDEDYKVKTTFRSLWKEDTLYFHFTCQDKYITAKETQRDGKPFLDDCAEVFLIPAGEDRSMHFCFEVNVLKAINDVLYFDNLLGNGIGVIKAYNPDVKIGVNIEGTVNDNSDEDKGWSLEMAIPGSAFSRVIETAPIAAGERWSFIAVRQNRDKIDEEHREIITNCKLVPGLDVDVHQPDCFGSIEFVK